MTETVIKLVSVDWESHNFQKWALDKTVKIDRKKQSKILCTQGVLHAYRNINQALLMNPIHVGWNYFRVLEATTPEIVANDGTKLGMHALTPTRELALPDWYVNKETHRRVSLEFAVLCAEAALPVYERTYGVANLLRLSLEDIREYLKGSDLSYIGAHKLREAERRAELEASKISTAASHHAVRAVKHAATAAQMPTSYMFLSAQAAGFAALAASTDGAFLDTAPLADMVVAYRTASK